MKKLVAWSVLIVCACAVSAFAQNKVVFDNQSGEPALVKLIGPTQTQVEVPNGAKAGADAAAGRYVIKVRYGTPGKYRYSKGEEFEVKETATARSETTITLHKVVAGNYDSQDITMEAFDAVETSSPSRLASQATTQASCRVGNGQYAVYDAFVALAPGTNLLEKMKARNVRFLEKDGAGMQLTATGGVAYTLLNNFRWSPKLPANVGSFRVYVPFMCGGKLTVMVDDAIKWSLDDTGKGQHGKKDILSPIIRLQNQPGTVAVLRIVVSPNPSSSPLSPAAGVDDVMIVDSVGKQLQAR